MPYFPLASTINMYLGLHEVHVSSVDEAILVLRLGLKHRHVASTKLNYQSSRSHSIYTIKLVRLANVGKPSKALINRLALHTLNATSIKRKAECERKAS